MKTLLLVPLFVSSTVLAQRTPDPIVSRSPVILHEQLSASCELAEPATLIEYKGYEVLAFDDSGNETYSAELGEKDLVELSPTVPEKARKLAKESGFHVRDESSELLTRNSIPTTSGSSCPDIQQAISSAHRHHLERRTELQKHLYRLDQPDGLKYHIVPPTPISETKTESDVNAKSAASPEKPKVKNGVVVVLFTVDPDGRVDDAKVAQPLDRVLDQRALDAVRRWRFSPARLNGLPVAVQTQAEVNFKLD